MQSVAAKEPSKDPSKQPSNEHSKQRSKQHSKQHTKQQTKQHTMPLNSTWDLIYQMHSDCTRDKGYTESLHTVLNVASVSRFWMLMNNVPPPSIMVHGITMRRCGPITSMTLFVSGQRPVWEDFVGTCCCTVSIMLTRQSAQSIDKAWLDACVCTVGEHDIPLPSSKWLGVRIVNRPYPGKTLSVRLEVWICKVSQEEVALVMCWLRSLGLAAGVSKDQLNVSCMWHDDARAMKTVPPKTGTQRRQRRFRGSVRNDQPPLNHQAGDRYRARISSVVGAKS